MRLQPRSTTPARPKLKPWLSVRLAGRRLSLSSRVCHYDFTHPPTHASTNTLTDQLKKNPMMGEDELENVSSGLGKEASAQGLAGVSGKLGGLGGGNLPKF